MNNNNNNAVQPANQPAAQNAQNANLNNIFNNLGVNFQSLVASTLRQYPRRGPAPGAGSIANRRSRYPFPSVTDLANWALASAIKRELIALQKSVIILRRTIETDEENAPQALAALKLAQESILKLDRLLQVILDAIPIEARPNASSAIKANKVFDVAELLEKILLNCDYHDFVNAMGVNRSFREAFRRSPRLQQIMGLRPVTDGSPFSPVATPFFMSRGCIVKLEDHHRYGHHVSDNEMVLSAVFNGTNPFEEHPLPRVSQRFRDTLICQPPIKQMRVRAGEASIQRRQIYGNADVVAEQAAAKTRSSVGETPTICTHTHHRWAARLTVMKRCVSSILSTRKQASLSGKFSMKRGGCATSTDTVPTRTLAFIETTARSMYMCILRQY